MPAASSRFSATEFWKCYKTFPKTKESSEFHKVLYEFSIALNTAYEEMQEKGGDKKIRQKPLKNETGYEQRLAAGYRADLDQSFKPTKKYPNQILSKIPIEYIVPKGLSKIREYGYEADVANDFSPGKRYFKILYDKPDDFVDYSQDEEQPAKGEWHLSDTDPAKFREWFMHPHGSRHSGSISPSTKPIPVEERLDVDRSESIDSPAGAYTAPIPEYLRSDSPLFSYGTGTSMNLREAGDWAREQLNRSRICTESDNSPINPFDVPTPGGSRFGSRSGSREDAVSRKLCEASAALRDDFESDGEAPRLEASDSETEDRASPRGRSRQPSALKRLPRSEIAEAEPDSASRERLKREVRKVLRPGLTLADYIRLPYFNRGSGSIDQRSIATDGPHSNGVPSPIGYKTISEIRAWSPRRKTIDESISSQISTGIASSDVQDDA